jgi:transcriptional regulator with XRE-family HTH domain
MTRRTGLQIAFGAVLRAARKAAELSQEELAHRSGIHRTFVSQIERGVKSPTLLTMERLASALKVPLPELIEKALATTTRKERAS